MPWTRIAESDLINIEEDLDEKMSDGSNTRKPFERHSTSP